MDKDQVESPKISIVTVVYNGGNCIEETIKSVVNQDYINLEYIIVDGASTDETLHVIKKYENNPRSILVLSEKDKGVYDAMNKGIAMATGDWILFMNAGDFFYTSNTVSKVFENPIAFKDCSVIYGDAEFRLKHLAYVNRAAERVDTNQYMPFSHQAAFTRVEVAAKYQFDLSYKIAADAAFFLKLVIDKHCIKHFPEIICSYNALEGLSADNDVKRCLEIVELQGRLNGVDTTNEHFTAYIKEARKQALLKKWMPKCLWTFLREKKLKKIKETYSIDD